MAISIGAGIHGAVVVVGIILVIRGRDPMSSKTGLGDLPKGKEKDMTPEQDYRERYEFQWEMRCRAEDERDNFAYNLDQFRELALA